MNFRNVDGLQFSWLCEKFEEIMKTRDCESKRKRLTHFMSLFPKNESFHAILRLILPELERVRGPYGVKEYTLANTYIRILGLPPDYEDATLLMNYGAACYRKGDRTGDFADVAFYVLVNKCGESQHLTIGEVNARLTAIAEKHAEHDPRGVDDLLIELINKTSAFEQKWLIRILLKKMHLGLSHNQILRCYHPDACELYETTNSIYQICCTLRKNLRLHEINISVFQPFRPMLCERVEVNKFELFESMYMETKMDGERFQIHYKEGKFKYFSRNGHDFTQNYGEDESSGIYTRRIKPLFNSSAKSFIIDGEMMGWDESRKSLVTKAANIDVKKLRVGDRVQPCFYVFDLIFLDDRVLTDYKLSDRLCLLDKLFQPLEGVLMRTPREIICRQESVLEALNLAIDNREEGIVVKRFNSIYKPNARNAGWYKIKPEYSDNSLVELDVLVIGGYYGTGRYRSQISHFLLGLAQPTPDGTPEVFESLARVSSGFSALELVEINDKLTSHWHKFRPSNPPINFLLASEKPDLWIEPSNSCILQVKATEVERSTKYYCGFSLRFVRIERARYDKSWKDCLTTDEFHKLRKASGGKLTTGHILEDSKNKSRKRCNEVECTSLTKRQASEKDIIRNIFSGKEFNVLSGDALKKIDEIENLIIQNGGSIRPTPTSHTTCLVAGTINVKVKNAIKASKHVIIHYKWILDCISVGKYLDWTPSSIISATFTVNKMLETQYDQYGDSFLEELTPDSLKSILENIKLVENSEESLDSEVKSLSTYSFFKDHHAFFASDDGSELDPEKYLFRFFGGTSVDILDKRCFIIIRDVTKIPALVREYIANYGPIDVVNARWIVDCCKKREILDKEEYIVN